MKWGAWGPKGPKRGWVLSEAIMDRPWGLLVAIMMRGGGSRDGIF